MNDLEEWLVTTTQWTRWVERGETRWGSERVVSCDKLFTKSVRTPTSCDHVDLPTVLSSHHSSFPPHRPNGKSPLVFCPSCLTTSRLTIAARLPDSAKQRTTTTTTRRPRCDHNRRRRRKDNHNGWQPRWTTTTMTQKQTRSTTTDDDEQPTKTNEGCRWWTTNEQRTTDDHDGWRTTDRPTKLSWATAHTPPWSPRLSVVRAFVFRHPCLPYSCPLYIQAMRAFFTPHPLFTVLTPPFVLSLGSVGFHPLSSVFTVLTPPFSPCL